MIKSYTNFLGHKIYIDSENLSFGLNSDTLSQPTLSEPFVDHVRALTLISANKCNQQCRYCYANNGGFEEYGAVMPFEVAKKAIDLLYKSAKENEIPSAALAVFGGEPLIEIELLKQIFNYAKTTFTDIPLIYITFTNATLVTPEIASFLKEFNVCVGVSLDGNKKTHDINRKLKAGGSSYEQAVRGINELIKNNINIIGRITINDDCPNLQIAIQDVFKIGIRKIAYDFDVKMSDESFAEFIESSVVSVNDYFNNKSFEQYEVVNFSQPIIQLCRGVVKKNHCSAGNSYITISAKG
jgi:uncharacterized protein